MKSEIKRCRGLNKQIVETKTRRTLKKKKYFLRMNMCDLTLYGLKT